MSNLEFAEATIPERIQELIKSYEVLDELDIGRDNPSEAMRCILKCVEALIEGDIERTEDGIWHVHYLDKDILLSDYLMGMG